MITAYDYPLLGFFWTALWFFLLFAWLMALFHVIGDVFRSDDMGGFSKAIWILFVLFMPFLGVFVYLIARGDKMAQHAAESQRAQQAAFQSYVQETAGSSSVGDQIAQLASLHDSGAITDAEFETGKAKILG
jgi:type VI protein secretion system component VasK